MVDDICTSVTQEDGQFAIGQWMNSAELDHLGFSGEISKKILPEWGIKALDELSENFGVQADESCVRVGIGKGWMPSAVLGFNTVEMLGHTGNLEIGIKPHRLNYHPLSDKSFLGKGGLSVFDEHHARITDGEEFHIQFSGTNTFQEFGLDGFKLTSSLQAGSAILFNGQGEIYYGRDIKYERSFGADRGIGFVASGGADVTLKTSTGAEGSFSGMSAVSFGVGDTLSHVYSLSTKGQMTVGGDRQGVSWAQNITGKYGHTDTNNSLYLSGTVGEHNGTSFTQVEGGICHTFNETTICAVAGHDTAFDVQGLNVEPSDGQLTFGGKSMYGGLKIEVPY